MKITTASPDLVAATATRQGTTRDACAFTLLEVLVIIAIIGILAAFLLPTISKSKEQARQAYCVGNLRQFGVALQNFLTDNQAYPSLMAGTNSDAIPGLWAVQLERGGFDISKSNKRFFAEGVWNCPSARWNTNYEPGLPYVPTFCYGYNVFGIGGGPSIDSLGLNGQFISRAAQFGPLKESVVVSPSAMMAMGESFVGDSMFRRSPVALLEHIGYASSRHSGKVNVVFCDAHVESPSLNFVFADTSDPALIRWNHDHQPHRDQLPQWNRDQ